MAPRQNLFFTELVDALRAELKLLGIRSSMHVGNFPRPRTDLIYLLVPPHEYFTLMHGRRGPSPETLRRTIFICAEQPDTSFFEGNVEMAPRAGAVFDINRHAIRAFAARGVTAHHLQLGWTQGWDHLQEGERDIDILFLGALSQKREQWLANQAKVLSRRRPALILSDNSKPNWAPSQSFRIGDAKWNLLARSKVLVNVHQGDSPYFEWLRLVQAMVNGAVVVTEHSLDFAPLVPGRHFLTGGLDSLGLLIESLLDDDEWRWEIRSEAYRTMREDLPLRHAVRDLVSAAETLAAVEPVPERDDPFFLQPQPNPELFPIFHEARTPPSSAAGDHNLAALRRIGKDLRLELIDCRRRISRLELTVARGEIVPRLELIQRTRAYAGMAPRISVLTALYNHADHILEALDSLTRSHESSWEVIVVDDGSGDDSCEVASAWMHRHEDASALLLRHPVNRGLGHARNSALGWARGEFCFVLDADNEIHPHCFTRLLAKLDDDPRAAFAYGILERFRRGRSLGLLNIFPWEPGRLRTTNYIDAMTLLRTQILRDRFGGYAVDQRLHGWEDYDLWCRLAEAGEYGALVPEIVARYRSTAHSMLSLTNLSVTDAFSLLIERAPNLMAGMTPPLG